MFLVFISNQIVKQRISQFQHGVVATASNTHFLWNHYPGGLVINPDYSEKLEDYPFFIRRQKVTAIIIVIINNNNNNNTNNNNSNIVL